MPTYQVAPYKITLRPRRSDGADTLYIDDVGLEKGPAISLADVSAWTLQRAAFEGPFRSTADSDTQFAVSDLVRGDRATSFSVIRGTKGIRSVISKPGEKDFPRDENHREDIEYNNLLVFPRNGHHAFLLTERIGSGGVYGFVKKLLTDTLRIHMGHLTVDMAPLANASDLEAFKGYVQALTFRLPNPDDKSGKREGRTGQQGYFTVKWHARNKRSLKAYTDESGKRLALDKIYGVLGSAADQFGGHMTAPRAVDLGIQADLTVAAPQGGTRTFTLGQDEGPAIVYVIKTTTGTALQDQAEADTPGATSRPDLSEFLTTCRTVVADLSGKYDVLPESTKLVSVPEKTKAIEAPEGWKAEWSVTPDVSAAD